MKNEDLLKAIGQIDDEIIEAAETKRDSKMPSNINVVGGAKKSGWRGAHVVLKSFAAVAACLVLVIGIASATGTFRMGASKSADTEMAYDMSGDSGFMEAPAAVEEYLTVSNAAMEKMKATEDVAGAGNVEAQRDKKLVYRAWVDVQTTDFDESVKQLEAMVNSYGGYIETSNISNGSYYSDQLYKNGYYQVRIPADSYNAFMNSACQQWHVTNKNENLEDITKAYYEVADRIETLERKEVKLHELLSKATSLSDIITIENELSNNEYELNNLKNSMAQYDEQVTYATVEISLNQVTQVGSSIGSDGFGARMLRALKNGIRNFGEGIADFVVWMGYNVIEIAIAIVAIILIRKFHLVRRLVNWIKR